MAARRAWPIGQCRVCLGWGEKAQFADCVGCSCWRRQYPDTGSCRRCGYAGHLNTDGLCRLCLQVIRTFDPGWITDPLPGQPCQLALILPGAAPPRAQPIDRPLRGQPRDASRPRSWLERQRAAVVAPRDDPTVCPPAVRGQLALFPMRRRLTEDHARRIRDRDLADYDRLRSAAVTKASQDGLSTAWWRSVCWMLRLALAVRDADGDNQVAEEVLDDLPRAKTPTAALLREAGLLRPRQRSRPVDLRKPHRSCRDCDCWGFRTVCAGCNNWRRHPIGDCQRCRRTDVPLLAGNCRACCLHLDQHGPDAQKQAWTQLWLGGDLAPRLAIRSGTLGYHAPHQKGRQRAAAARPPAPPLSAHLADPNQGVLFDARRDWSCITIGQLDRLPSLTDNAQALLDAFGHHARHHCWDEQVRRLSARSLRILLAWVDADAPIDEADIRSLPTDRPGTSARRILQFLTQRGLAIPEQQLDVHERVVEERIQTLPDNVADELRRWVLVLRGAGRRAHPAMPFETIRKYLGYLHPVLTEWAGRVTSLREITNDDVRQALTSRPGSPGRDLLSALRSLFRALKQERLIFRDPTRCHAARHHTSSRADPHRPATRPDRPSRRRRGQVRRRARRHPRPRPARDPPPTPGRPRPCPRPHDRPPRPSPRRLSRRTHPRPGRSLAPRASPTVATDRQPVPAGQPTDRRRHPAPTDLHHGDQRRLPAARPESVQAPPRPHPRRSPPHRRPRPPHARVRHRRRDRHEVHLHRPPRTPINPLAMTAFGRSPLLRSVDERQRS
jgi:hypothetical protein